MKKILKVIIIVFIFSLLSYLVYNVYDKMQYKNNIEKSLQIIPEFSFKTLENKDFTKADLALNIPTIFIYFNTECDYCQHEAQNINKNIEFFKNCQILFVSTEDIKSIKEFGDNYNLSLHSNITFLYDSSNTFSNRFDATSVPYILVYNMNQELIKKHKGQLKVEVLIKLLENKSHFQQYK
ncbi:peroxiredoxin family protein [Yeosuana marina]|uniref:peroxiredoxin family protein n=1 Tax=Yeosuana marina TaxID=1565536 RepID=UPI0014232378|nr:redoxin domain-containing protein [Yeosuana marina]